MDEVEREDAFTDIVFDYFMQTDACRTRGLTTGMTSAQLTDWLNYLSNYSHALFGCGLLFSPLPGGVEAFGLANTEVVGLVSPRLGPDDASLLIDIYLSNCTGELLIPDAELVDLRARLERAAERRIDPSLSARLSQCP